MRPAADAPRPPAAEAPRLPARLRAAWERLWYAPVDAIQVATFRRALGLALLLYMAAWAREASEWLTPLGYHPSAAATPQNAPQVPLLEPWILPIVGVIFFAALSAVVLGARARALTAIVLVGVAYVTLADPIAAFTVNRLFIFAFFLLTIAPAPVATEDPGGPPTSQIAWPLRILQLTLMVHYGASAVCKALHGSWLASDDVLWTQVQGVYMTDAAAWMIRTFPGWCWAALQHGALAFEALAPLLFAVPRLRVLAIVLGIGMHAVIAVTMHQLIYFSLTMLCFYVLFVDPARLRWLWARVPGGPRA